MPDARPYIRKLADKLKNADRAQEISRQAIRAAEQRRFDKSASELQWRWEHDRDALLAEYVYRCPFCGATHEPTVHQHPFRSGSVTIWQRESCGCMQEAEALRLEEARAAAERKAFEAHEWRAALGRAGLTGKLATATLDTYCAESDEQKAQKDAVAQYCATLLQGQLDTQPWLVLYGPYGLGKTHLACAVLHEAMRAGWRMCYFRPWAEYLRRLMNSFEDDAEERTGNITAELMAGKLVVIDDLDSKPPSRSGFAEAELFTALNKRYNDRVPTVLTFNRTPTQMAPWLGAAIVDRLIEAQFQAVEFQGASYRSDLPWRV